MRDIQDMTEDEIAKAIDALAPPARPFGLHSPDDVAYFTEKVWQCFDNCGVPANDELVLQLVSMFLSEVEAIEDTYSAEIISLHAVE